MAERSKALRSGHSPLLWAWVRIPLLTNVLHLIRRIASVQRDLYSIVLPYMVEEQSGAVEACWAHNPEVRRSKLRSANIFIDSATK